MAVHSTSLYAGGSVGAGPTTLYTVPAGKRTIWKDATVINLNAAAAKITYTIKRGGVAVAFMTVYCAAAGASGDTQHPSFWIVLNAGDVITCGTSVGTCVPILSGSELTL